MPRPRVTSTFLSSPTIAPLGASLRIPAIIGTGRKEFTITEQVTRGVGETSDTLANTATSIIRVGNFRSTNDYTDGQDYQETAGAVDWSLGGIQPADGAKYFVTYTFAKVAADFAPKLFTANFSDIIDEYGPIALDNNDVLESESYITMCAQIMKASGASVFIIAQVNNAADVPVASEFQTALDALENTKNLGVVPFYICPLIGNLSDSDATAVNTAALVHANKMADDQFRLERRVYTGLKNNASATDVINAAQAIADSRLSLAANFDGQVTVSDPAGNKEVTLDGAFAAAAVAGFRSSQEVSQPAMNKAIAGLTKFLTNFDPVTIDLLVEAGALVLEDDAGTIKVVDDNTTNSSDDIENSIPTVEHRDVLITGLRKRIRDKFKGRRGGNTLLGEMEKGTDDFIDQDITKGAIQKRTNAQAARVTGTLNKFKIEFSYLPAGKVRDVEIRFSVDLSL